MNAATVIVGVIVLAIFVLAFRNMLKNIISGKGNCSCGCDNCPSSAMCHPAKKEANGKRLDNNK